jgi:predicted Zn-dependent protease
LVEPRRFTGHRASSPQRPHSVGIVICILFAISIAGAGCRTSPPPRLSFETTEDSLRAGRQGEELDEARQVLLDDEALDTYLTAVGRRVFEAIRTPRFRYSFRVVEEAQPNAFALPDGSVFVTRGLLVLMNDEDELACLLGHEIAHVEQRHTARHQPSSLPVSPLLGPWRRAAERAPYTQVMEEEADFLGQQLCAAAGHDPMGLSTLLRSLRQVERIQFGLSRQPSFMVTHPGLQNRATLNAARAREMTWRRDPRIGDPRAALLQETEGIDVGQRPQSGVFIDNRFLDPVLGYQITFPNGWVRSANNSVVGARSPDTGAVVFLVADRPAGDPKTRAEEWLAGLTGNEIQVERAQGLSSGRMPAWRLELTTGGRINRTTGTATFVSHAGRTFRLIAVAPSRAARTELRRAMTAIRSFRPLSVENRSLIRARRLRVVTAEPDESLADLGARADDTWVPTRRAVMNGLFSNHVFSGGELAKIARSEPYESPEEH